jgi:hypothetical protein
MICMCVCMYDLYDLYVCMYVFMCNLYYLYDLYDLYVYMICMNV